MPRLHRSGRRLHRKQFQKFIFSWWVNHKRDLLWRHTHDPYNILVSEVMLQQTQVSRALPTYRDFLAKFPDVQSLARASTADVLRAWKGMGYNRRALYLKKTAAAIVHEYKGKFPKSEKELVKLPGLGKYTARAILVFAFRENMPLVDTNIRQIITHFFFDDTPQKDAVIWETAKRLLPRGKSWEWHQALMDYGALELPDVPGLVKKQKPFKGSNRFFRGKIVDMLREGPVPESVLLKEVSASIVEGLVKDGLIVRKNGTVSLPD